MRPSITDSSDEGEAIFDLHTGGSGYAECLSPNREIGSFEVEESCP